MNRKISLGYGCYVFVVETFYFQAARVECEDKEWLINSLLLYG